jgi:hypothetical protein
VRDCGVTGPPRRRDHHHLGSLKSADPFYEPSVLAPARWNKPVRLRGSGATVVSRVLRYAPVLRPPAARRRAPHH